MNKNKVIEAIQAQIDEKTEALSRADRSGEIASLSAQIRGMQIAMSAVFSLLDEEEPRLEVFRSNSVLFDLIVENVDISKLSADYFGTIEVTLKSGTKHTISGRHDTYDYHERFGFIIANPVVKL